MSDDNSKRKGKSGCGDGCDFLSGLGDFAELGFGCLGLFEGCNFLILFSAALLAILASPSRLLKAARTTPGTNRSTALGLALIDWYKTKISPRLPARCVYEESCSTYGHRMLREHGLLQGSWRTARRIASCR